jgi:DUF917 family protein
VQGEISSIELSRATGFLQGVTEVRNESEMLSIHVLNEYMQASKNGEVLAAAPEIITMIHNDTIISSDMAANLIAQDCSQV